MSAILSNSGFIPASNEARRLVTNPATLSNDLGSLFPPGAIAAELREPGDPQLLLPAEAIYVVRAVPKRVQEFAAGRLCARRALAEFGIVDFPVRAADDRQPVWPGSMVGSITHTAGYGAAVVAERRSAAAVGLDSEVVGDVKAELWPRVCVPTESAWIESLPAMEQAAAVTLIFSAKEAFYKCQFALVRERLNFHDVRVEAAAWGASSGAFRILPTRRIAVCARAAPPLHGRYRFHQGFVTAGMALADVADAAVEESAQ
ncbi:MAG TPA: 4'-phosphopantetheinyl transferase superfamily protein [Steroidobacteraceae bacterium]|jgi:4'-phosphopantetheinyl transferase EntD